MATVAEVTVGKMTFHDLDDGQNNFIDETMWLNESLPVGSVYRMSSFTMAHGTIHLLLTSVVLSVIILATIFGNVFVIAAIVLEKNLRNVANYLIASLAAADLMVAALVMPLAAVSEVSTTWFLGSVLCEAWTLFDMLCCTASILHLVAISLDRYWAVTRVDYIHHRSAQRILGMIGASWAVSALISLPPLFGHRDLDQSADETGVCRISQDRGMAVFSTVGAFYLPLIAMIIIYARIYRAARSRIRKQNFARRKTLESRHSEISEKLRLHSWWKMSSSKSRKTSGIKRVGNDNDEMDEETSVSIPLTEYSSVTAASTPPVTPSHRKYRGEQNAIRIVLRTFKRSCSHGTTDRMKSDSERGFSVGRLSKHQMSTEAESGRHSMASLTSDSTGEYHDSTGEYRNQSAELRSKYDDDENSSLPLRRVSCASVTKELVDVFDCTQLTAANSQEPISISGLMLSGTTGDLRLSKRTSAKRLTAETVVTVTSPGPDLRSTRNGPKTTLVDTSVAEGSLPIGGFISGQSSSSLRKARDGQSVAREKLKQKRERKAARTLAIVTGTFVLCWLPFFIVALIQPFFDDSQLPGYPPELRSVVGWLGYINSLLNPVIYTVFNPDFRSAFRKILCDRYRTRSSGRTR